jgi:hypothetical protein
VIAPWISGSVRRVTCIGMMDDIRYRHIESKVTFRQGGTKCEKRKFGGMKEIEVLIRLIDLLVPDPSH